MQDLLDHPDVILRAGELADGSTVRRKLRATRDLKLSQLRDLLPALADHSRARFPLETLQDPSWIDSAIATYREVATRARLVEHPSLTDLADAAPILFEGAQGVLLDEWYGFHPHTTWSTTTFANADRLLDECAFPHPRTRLGVLRTYATRHGAGPLVTEDPALAPLLPEPHNNAAGWQGRFRVGPFDAVAARYALSVTGPVDAIALTHLDRLPQLPKHVCSAYRGDAADESFFCVRNHLINDIVYRTQPDLTRQEKLTHLLQTCRPDFTPIARPDLSAFIELVEREINTPVRVTSAGPTAREKRWRS
jgi:adenylosuccinate synthase